MLFLVAKASLPTPQISHINRHNLISLFLSIQKGGWSLFFHWCLPKAIKFAQDSTKASIFCCFFHMWHIMQPNRKNVGDKRQKFLSDQLVRETAVYIREDSILSNYKTPFQLNSKDVTKALKKLRISFMSYSFEFFFVRLDSTVLRCEFSLTLNLNEVRLMRLHLSITSWDSLKSSSQ